MPPKEPLDNVVTEAAEKVNVASSVPMLFKIAATAAVAVKAIEITPPAAVGVIVPIVVVVTLPVVGFVWRMLTVITPPTKPPAATVWNKRTLEICAPAGNTNGVGVVLPTSAVVNKVAVPVVVVIGLVM